MAPDRADLADPEVVERLLHGVDACLHFARRGCRRARPGASSDRSDSPNLRVTAAVLTAEFRARVRKVAWLSSTTDDIRAIQSYLREPGVSY